MQIGNHSYNIKILLNQISIIRNFMIILLLLLFVSALSLKMYLLSSIVTNFIFLIVTIVGGIVVAKFSLVSSTRMIFRINIIHFRATRCKHFLIKNSSFLFNS